MVKESKKEKEERESEEFYEIEQQRLWEDQVREGGKLENIVFLVASGSMVLSATAVLNLVTEIHLIFLPLLWISWSLLSLSIFFRFLAHYSIDRCVEYDYKELEKWREEGSEYGTHPWIKIMNFSNHSAFVGVILGVIFLILFAYVNISILNTLN